MASGKGNVKKVQPSIKHSCNFFSEAKRKLSKISDNHQHVEYAYALQRYSSKRRDNKLSQILSRDAIVSAVDVMWDRSGLDECSKFRVYEDSTQCPADQKGTSSRSPPAQQPRVRLLRVAEKMNDSCKESFVSRFNQTNGAKSISGFCEENGFPFEARWETGKLYSYMAEVVPSITRHHTGRDEIENNEFFEDRVPGPVSSEAECTSVNVYSCDSAFDTTGSEGRSNPAESRSTLLESITESPGDSRICRSTDASYLLLFYKDRCSNNKMVDTISSKCSRDCRSEIPSPGDNSQEDNLSIVENKVLLERDRKDKETEVCSPSTETHTYPFVKERHAFAGALAGISVSLCLHPLDTVKTMVQSCRLEKSLCYTGRSIISERGFSGLYRGIASNIASSAPISALYTFTYESVKGDLLPLFPKEYCSLTHCIAGGSASIATSFIFTPSERIKQQMQVSSHYRNCWTALVGIIQKGGLLSLYAGWSAVLCRNIPHSIIKFYVYENMKQIVLPSPGPRGQASQPTTLQTLTCGGLAGSAAAFFTTPFDVVKTRLQTQIPGTRNQHPNVYQTLQSIRKQEGLKGLYRGLIPRLVMYMSQGAIFFASYEFYKSVLSLEATQPDSSSPSGTKQKMEIALNH